MSKLMPRKSRAGLGSAQGHRAQPVGVTAASSASKSSRPARRTNLDILKIGGFPGQIEIIDKNQSGSTH
jgi:hypothetical protein